MAESGTQDGRLTRTLAWSAAGAALWWLGTRTVRRARRLRFAQRVAFITGGSRGLGLLLARRLAALGARVAICARDAEELRRAESDIRRHGDNVLSIVCDVTDRAAVEQAVRQVENHWGRIDVLINNAGVVQVGPQENMTLDDYEAAMRVHYWGPLYAMLAVLPGMRARRSGRIVNIASIGGMISVPHMLPYSASKFALVGLSQGCRAELIRDGVYVTTVCPGLMRTGSAPHALFKGRHQAEYAWFSIAASAPLMAMSAERAADRILEACRDGRAELVLSLPARLAGVAHGVAPAMVAETLSLVNRWLPSAGGMAPSVSGADSRPAWLPGWLTHLGDAAGRRNNETSTRNN